MSILNKKTAIIGASGYAGAELAFFLSRHPNCDLAGLYVSANSADAGKSLSALYPKYRGVLDMIIEPLNDIEKVAESYDVIFLATAHEVSHDIAPQLLQKGVVIFDLSGAFRVPNVDFYETFYGFTHQHPDYLKSAVYGLAEFASASLQKASLIAVPGCYPTAAQLALKPLIDAEYLDLSLKPIINAISGVSGAGRKAALNTSFCEVSLQPYGVFTHRHQPEISHHLGTDVIFTPHLGQFDRGILATITCKVAQGITLEQFKQVFSDAYCDSKIVRVLESGFPALKSVVGLPYCDIGFAISDGYAIIVSAEDNLLKGAASQAVQCFNHRFGHEDTLSLL